MSIELKPIKQDEFFRGDISVTRLSAGETLGMYVQLTGPGGYVQLSDKGMKQLNALWKKHVENYGLKTSDFK